MQKLTRIALAITALLLVSPITPANAEGCYNPQPEKDYSGCSYVGIDLSGRDLSYTNLENTDLTNTNLSGANLEGVKSGGIKGTPAALPSNWYLVGGYLFGPGANFYGKTLKDLNLSNVNLSGANLEVVKMTNVNLSYANLSDTLFRNSIITGSNLYSTNFTGADFTSSSISSTDISGAIFEGATLDYLNTSNNTGDPFSLPTDWREAEGFLIGPKANLMAAVFKNIDFRSLKVTDVNFSYATFENCILNGMDLGSTTLKWANFDKSSLTGTDLSKNDLEGLRSVGVIGTPLDLPTGWKLRSGFLIGPKANLSSLNMANVNFSGTDLTDVSLAASNLSNANFTGVDLRQTIIEDANLTEANLEQTNLTGVSLRGIIGPRVIGQPIGLDPKWQFVYGYLIGPGANLSSVDFRGLDLTGVNLTEVNFIYANLSGVNLTNVDLTGVNLSGVNLTGAVLEGADLTGATMFQLNGRGIVGVPKNIPTNWRLIEGFILGPSANLNDANLSGVDLRNVNLTGASLLNVNFTGADLRGAIFTGANIDNSNFTGAKLLNVVTGNLVGTPTGLPKNFSFADGRIKVALILSPTPKAVGLAKVGSTLTAIPGTWDVGVTLSYQWFRNGFAIEGATAKTYKLSPADVKKGVSVAVTGTGTGEVTKTKLSLQTLVGPGIMSAKLPKITGAVAKGKTVTATATPWVNGAKLSYSWLLDGKPIKGATKNTYKILASQVGKKLSVLVKQTATGYTTASKASTAVKVKK